MFGFEIPKTCQDVDATILNPKNTWASKEEYDKTIAHVSTLF